MQFVSGKQLIATRKSCSVMLFSERLNNKMRVSTFFSSIPTQLCFVATCSGTCCLAWRGRVEYCIDKDFARLISERQYLEILDRLRGSQLVRWPRPGTRYTRVCVRPKVIMHHRSRRSRGMPPSTLWTSSHRVRCFVTRIL
jgi:hypothetical protein